MRPNPLEPPRARRGPSAVRARIAGLCLVLLCLLGGSPAPAQGPPAEPPRALWVWSDPSPEIVPEALAHRVDHLFVHVRPGGADSPDLRALLQGARRAGISVWAMAGAPDWAARPRRIVRWVAETSRLSGIAGFVLDVEPYLLPEWDSEGGRRALVRRYARGLRRAGRRDPRPLMAAVPFWWDHQDQRVDGRAVVETLLDVVDGVVVMAYRDRPLGPDGIVELARGEIAAAGRRGKRAWIGMQTDDDELDKLTFHEEGLGALEAALEETRRALAGEPGLGGFAIHHLAALRMLR